MDKLEPVYMRGTLVGTLHADRYGMLIFKYDAAYLLAKEATPLSASLPLQEHEYYGGAAQTFFAGLLPEESELKQIAQSLGTDTNNSFRLLQEIGKECVGAISIGEKSDSTTATYIPIEQIDWENIVGNSLGRVAYLYKEKKQRLSLAGAQSKMGALYRDGKYYFSQNGLPTNCIIKFPSDRFLFITENEFATMSVAKWLNLEVPDIRLDRLGGVNCFVIDRFDRITEIDQVRRVHQEDFCQALGIHPQNKYEQDGGPSFQRCIELIRGVCTIPVLDIAKFIDLFIFNILLGNRDTHGKNFSFMYTNGKISLAPAYDLVCTAFYTELADTKAMKIGKQYDYEFLTSDDFKVELNAANISFKQFQHKWSVQTGKIEGLLPKIRGLSLDSDFTKQYNKLIRERLAHYKDIFSV